MTIKVKNGVKVDRATDEKMRVEFRPCCLCGEFVEHVDITGRGKNLHLIFRASVDLDGTIWATLKDHGPPDCPDPHPSTRSFWEHDTPREAYKADMRKNARLKAMARATTELK